VVNLPASTDAASEILAEKTPNTFPSSGELETLGGIERRVLWLATSMIHYANKVRTTTSGVKVGGHQASSASVVSIMTALYFWYLKAQDRVSVKPHAAPVLHAINYLLGRLDANSLTQLRAFGGLQSYPSRTKDPDPVDFSTGSVGIGATATIWSALAQRYVAEHFQDSARGRLIALVGDAELDEGAVWEALVDPMVPHLGEVLWIVDLNRQSLDRVVPDIAAGRIGAMFEAAGWNTITVKYGSILRGLFARDGGDLLMKRIDAMGNEEYQHLLRTKPAELRDGLAGNGRGRKEILDLLADVDDYGVLSALENLGGHDIGALIAALGEADRVVDRPSVIFAYTIKGWRLPSHGHPSNHSSLMSEEQWIELAGPLGADPEDPWSSFPAESPEGRMCDQAARRLRRPESATLPSVTVPVDFGRLHRGSESTQQAFGRFFLDISREAAEVAERIVTVSPDVASSTNLGGWINRAGIWNVSERTDWFADDKETVLHWKETRSGQHIELGIAEVNLVGLLSELGTTWSRYGRQLFPIGTVYDPFVGRALEPWSFGIYAGGQSILVGTPSGVTLAPEGGAHQSVITPSIGLEQPRCVAWEPAFGQDLEWALLASLSKLGRPDGSSAYFRLTTRPIEQGLASVPVDASPREVRRQEVLAGGYRLRETPRPSVLVTLVGMGAVLPEVLASADELESLGLGCDVICLTSADLVFRAFQARQGIGPGSADVLGALFPRDRSAPIVSVLDGHPHTLSFLGAINSVPITCLGVSDFGQVGDVGDLYRHFGIDRATIVGAAWDQIEQQMSPARTSAV
jgi:pyruvate dehydrogenase E1 component